MSNVIDSKTIAGRAFSALGGPVDKGEAQRLAKTQALRLRLAKGGKLTQAEAGKLGGRPKLGDRKRVKLIAWVAPETRRAIEDRLAGAGVGAVLDLAFCADKVETGGNYLSI